MLHRHQRGSLLVELLVVCLLISLLLPFLVAAMARLQEHYTLAKIYHSQHTMKAAIESHFQAQWGRLVPANCHDETSLSLIIGSTNNKPDRLVNRDVLENSDWLQGVDYGACRTGITVSDNPIETALDCHWKSGDTVSFSSCSVYTEGQVLSVSGTQSLIQLEDESAIGLSGILESTDGFYWYLSSGKDEEMAFWRTPEDSGNSLELFNGIQQIAVYPLLDKDNDGYADTLAANYDKFTLHQIRGLWIEYQYQLSDCQANQGIQRQKNHVSMRGDRWEYAFPCENIANQLIVLKSKEVI